MRTPPPLDPADDVLFELARRRGIETSRRRVQGLLRDHADPGTLLALVEVAPRVGLSLEAGRGELEALEALEALPAVLHFESGLQSGFGLLEALGPGTARVWDRVHGSRELSREALAAHWTGIVVEVSRASEPPEPEPDWKQTRLEEQLLDEWQLPYALVGRGALRGAQAAWAVMLGLLVVLGLIALPAGLGGPSALLAALGVLGLGASLAMHAQISGGPVLCGAEGRPSCDSVLLSPWASPAGVPLSHLGVGAFLAWLGLLGSATLSGSSTAPFAVGLLALLGLVGSMGLIWVQVTRLRAFCGLCALVHAAHLGGALVFLFGVAPQGLPPGGALLAHLLWGALLAWLGAGLLMPALALSHDHDLATARLATLRASPLATVAEWLQQPADGPDPQVGLRLGRPEAAATLVAFVHPLCDRCGPLLDELEALLAERPEHFALVLSVAPMDPDDPRDHALCTWLLAVGTALGPEALLRAFRLAKARRELLLEGRFAELEQALGLDAEAIAQARPTAAELVARGQAARQRHAQGLPTLFLEGRRFEGELAHLARHPDLLAQLGPVPTPGGPE